MEIEESAIEVIRIETSGVAGKAQELALAVADEPSKLAAEAFLINLKSAQKRAKEFFAPILKSAYATWKEIGARQDIIVDPLLKAEVIIKSSLGRYNEAVEAERRVEQERLNKITREAQESAALEAARHAEQAGDHATAAAIVEQAATAPAPVIVAPKQEQTSGIRYVDRWVGEVIDVKALLGAILEGKAPITLVQVSEGEVNRFAAATKGSIQVAGIRFKVQKTVAAGGRK